MRYGQANSGRSPLASHTLGEAARGAIPARGAAYLTSAFNTD